MIFYSGIGVKHQTFFSQEIDHKDFIFVVIPGKLINKNCSRGRKFWKEPAPKWSIQKPQKVSSRQGINYVYNCPVLSVTLAFISMGSQSSFRNTIKINYLQ